MRRGTVVCKQSQKTLGCDCPHVDKLCSCSLLQPNLIGFRSLNNDKERKKPLSATPSHLIGEAGAGRGLDALVQVRVCEHDRRVLTPQLQGDLLEVAGAALCDQRTCGRGACEGHQRDFRVGDDRVARLGAGAKDDVDDSRRDACTIRGGGSRRNSISL